MQGRSDLASYKTGMNACLNAFPVEEGACPRRSGSRFAATTRNGKPGRIAQFDFEKNAPYNMEFTDGFLRLYGGTNNPTMLVTTGSAATVSSISAANPGVVNTSSAHGFTTGWQVQFQFTSLPPAALGTLQNRQFSVVVQDTTHFYLVDPVTQAQIDGTNLGWLNSYNVTATRILEIATPYTGGSWGSDTLKIVTTNLQAVLLNTAVMPQVLTATLGTPNTFALSAITFTDGPYLDPVKNSKFTPSGLTGTITVTVTPGDTNFTFAATDVGRLIRLFSEPLDWAVGTAYLTGDSVRRNGAYYTALSGSTGDKPELFPTVWSIQTDLTNWAWGIITAYTSTTVVTVALNTNTSLFYTTQGNTWRLGVYGGTNGYPTCGTYHEGRLWLSGAVPNRFDASTSNSVFDFTPTGPDGTVADDNAISEVFNASDSNDILWMASDPSGVICGTQAGEWLIQTSASGVPITPTSIQAHRMTRYGCAAAEPARCALTLVFVQKYQRKLFEYFADVFSNRFVAPNLSLTARHLTKAGIKEVAFQQEPAPIVWARIGDGSLVGVTYKRETLFSNQSPTFVGWHRHKLGSGRLVESITKSTSSGGNLDTLAMVTNDPATNIRHVEIFTDLFDEENFITDSWFVDDSVAPTGVTVSGTNLLLYGLWHLNGKTVSAVIGGLDCGDYLVANGSITVPLQADPDQLLTVAYLQSISSDSYGDLSVPLSTAAAGNVSLRVPMVVGFTFTTQGQLLRPITKDETGAATGPALGKTRRNHRFATQLVNTAVGIQFGTTFTKMHAAQFKSPGGKAYTPLQMFSGVFTDTIEDDNTYDGMLCWQVTRPLPAIITALGGFLSTQDR